jgi:hypothetical protein
VTFKATIPRLGHRTAFLLGGGPSLSGVDVERVHGRGLVIAINNSYRLAPWSDMLYFADRRWLNPEWGHLDGIAKVWGGGPIYTRAELHAEPQRSMNIGVLRHENQLPLSHNAGAVAGWCSGANAINVAFLAGAQRIVLLGFDGRSNGNWHKDHKQPVAPETYPDFIVPSFARMALALREVPGVEVLNATRGSSLSMFSLTDLDQVLA